MSDFKVAIIGAGPAGSTLALLLRKASINVTIFEGEANARARTQGGTLDLHNETGIAALKRAGLFDEFQKFARYDGEALTIANKNLKRYLNLPGTDKGSSRGRPEIDRSALREILLNALPDGIVKWNHRLRSIDDDLTLHFDHGTESGFHLVIGAEGTWSKVRSLVSPIKPYFSGISCFRLSITDVAEKRPDLHKLVNKGSLFAIGDGKFLAAAQLGDGSMSVSAYFLDKEDWQKDITYDMSDLDAVKAALLAKHEGWAPELLDLIKATDVEPWASNLYMLPIGYRWVHRPGVTLIGDAAHVMTPFAGEGVNLAMEDVMRLADAIIAAHKAGGKPADLDPRIKAFEEDMFMRAAKTQQLTYDMMTCNFFVDGAPGSTIDRYVIAAVGHELHWVFKPLLSVVVRAYFSYFRWRYPD